jgi:hypothetical protein
MKISGFTMVKNATKLYYPIAESIQSILPIVDEFIVALGDCDPDDGTRKAIESIASDKIKIIDTIWDLHKYPDGMENAHQTDIAKALCSGDWLFYLQADEVIHEKYLKNIEEACEKYIDNSNVEGLLFKYIHFWGDYKHHQNAHGWYKNEIRIIKNLPEIHSWESAQSFRRIPNFDGIHYRQQEGTYKLKVVSIDAYVYHYGWVRPPKFMQKKKISLDTIHKGEERVKKMYAEKPKVFNYGPLGRVPEFKGTHPAVMSDMIKKFSWSEELNYNRSENDTNREKFKHDKWKYRFLSFLEQKVLGGREIGGFKNYILLK